LHAINDIAGCLQLAEPPNGDDEVQFDTGEKLAEFVVQLASDARPLFFAHLLQAFGQRGVQIDIRWRRKLHASALLTRCGPFVPLVGVCLTIRP
jgi:hypothetical protein